MTHREFLATLDRRASSAGVVVPQALAEQLGTYFALLARWNQTMNLTGFSLDLPTDEAIDRLFIEPLVVARAVHRPVKAMIDIGSGGGSPAIPMSIALSPERTVLVEAKARKGTFLREVARALRLSDHIEVENARFEDLTANVRFSGKFDLLTVRAVRVGSTELATMSGFLESKGRLMLIRRGDEVSVPRASELSLLEAFSLHGDGRSGAIVMEKV